MLLGWELYFATQTHIQANGMKEMNLQTDEKEGKSTNPTRMHLG